MERSDSTQLVFDGAKIREKCHAKKARKHKRSNQNLRESPLLDAWKTTNGDNSTDGVAAKAQPQFTNEGSKKNNPKKGDKVFGYLKLYSPFMKITIQISQGKYHT